MFVKCAIYYTQNIIYFLSLFKQFSKIPQGQTRKILIPLHLYSRNVSCGVLIHFQCQEMFYVLCRENMRSGNSNAVL